MTTLEHNMCFPTFQLKPTPTPSTPSEKILSLSERAELWLGKSKVPSASGRGTSDKQPHSFMPWIPSRSERLYLWIIQHQTWEKGGLNSWDNAFFSLDPGASPHGILYHQVVLKETNRYNLIEIPIYTYIDIHTKGLCSKIMFLLEYWVFSKTPFASQNTLCTFPAGTVMFEQSFPRKTNCDSFYKKYISPESTNKNRSTWVRRGGSLFGNAYQWQGGSYELFMIFRFLHSNPPNCTWRPFKGHRHGRLLCIPDATNGAGSGDTNVLGSASYGARFRFYVKKAAVKKSKE